MKTKILSFAGLLLFLIALVCFVVCIAQEEKNTALIVIGLACNSVGFVFTSIVQRTNRKD